MNVTSKFVSTGVTAALFVLTAWTQATAAPPQPTIQSEEAAHPKIVVAIREMQNALRELSQTSDNFGGNKGQAVGELRNAIHSLKKALYYRLNMDDQAIDRVP